AQTGFVAAEYEELLAQLPGGGARANAGASSLSDLDVQIASLEAEIALLQETVQRSEQREADLFKQLLALIQKYGLTSTSADDLRDTLQRELAASQRLIKSHGSLPVAVRSVAVS